MESVLTAALVDIIVAHMATKKQGSRLAKFQATIAVLRCAEARGAWAPHESIKGNSGFYQGLLSKFIITGVDDNTPAGGGCSDNFSAKMCLQYGQRYHGPLPEVSEERGKKVIPVDPSVINAWIKIVNAAHELRAQLDAARPKPVITAIGLSPKVTKTLTEMNLDIDLPTITPAEIVPKRVQAFGKDGQPQVDDDGQPVMTTIYVVKWSKGCKLGQSRFYSGCEACGKSIPSGRYVPIEADCKKTGRIGLWIGCDCARNIFGVKDQGIAKG